MQFSVAATAGCLWEARWEAPWIALTAGRSGTGPLTVSYTVEANTTGAQRTGRIVVEGQAHTITQPAAAAAPTATVSLSTLYVNSTMPGGKRTSGIVALSSNAPEGRGACVRLPIFDGDSPGRHHRTYGGAHSEVLHRQRSRRNGRDRDNYRQRRRRSADSHDNDRASVVSGLSFYPLSMKGSTISTFPFVYLNGPAPAGGIAVTLASSHPRVTVPARVTVPEGATSVNFTVATAPVVATSTITITATSTKTVSANLTVTP